MKRANHPVDDGAEESGVSWSKPSGAADRYRMILNVHKMNGEHCCDVPVTPWTMISGVKDTIRQLKGYPVSTQVLLIRGRVCENHRPVSRYTNTRHTVASLVISGGTASSTTNDDGNHPVDYDPNHPLLLPPADADGDQPPPNDDGGPDPAPESPDSGNWCSDGS